MPSGKTHRSFLNLVAMILKSFIVMVIGFVSVPYLLRWLGSDQLGAYRLLIDWTTNISFLELGVGGSLIPIFCSAWSSGSSVELKKIISTGFWAYSKTLPVILFACFVLYLNLDHVILLEGSLRDHLHISFFIIISGFILLPFTVIQLYFEAIEETFVTSIIIFIQLILITILSLWFAYCGYGIIGQAFAFLIGLIFLNLVLSFKLWRRFRWHWSDLKSDVEIKKEIWKVNWSNFAVNSSRQVSLYMDNIVIGIFFSPAAVVPFFITVKLPLLLMGQLQNLGASVWASLVSYYHAGEYDLFNARLIEITKIISIVAVAIMVPIWSFNGEFITLWIGAENYLGITVTTLGLFIAFLQALNFFWGRVFVGTGHVRRQVFPAILSAVINLVLSLVLTRSIGISGPVWGTMISFLAFFSWYQLYLLKKIYRTPLLILVKSIVLPVILGSLVAFGITLLPHRIDSWLLLIISVVFTVACGLAFSALFLLTKGERRLWTKRLLDRFNK